VARKLASLKAQQPTQAFVPGLTAVLPAERPNDSVDFANWSIDELLGVARQLKMLERHLFGSNQAAARGLGGAAGDQAQDARAITAGDR